MQFINDLNLKKQAKELGVSVWQTPSFLFIVMGFVIIIAMTATYYVSSFYNDPAVLVVAESLVVIILFIIGNSVIRGVEQIAKLNRMKTEFVAIASHQLRTPLSAIRWETELLTSKFNEGLNEKQLKSIESINILGNRMTRLVNDLLDVARIDQGQLFLKKEKIDLAQLTQEMIDNFSSLASSRNIHISFKHPEHLPSIVGDSGKIRLIIENLLSNAIKYSVDHGNIEITLKRVDGFLVFGIKDNGIGIPKNQQDQIFKKFFRSNNVLKYQTEGTGLGLYIAKSIVEQSGGKIWFESRENTGTVFSFSLPVK